MLTLNAARTWNPDRMDPTRSMDLRRRMLADIRKRFREVKRRIIEHVRDDDAFGLVANLASIQVDLPSLLTSIQSIQSRIDPDDVIKLEDKPHVTVLYGLLTEQAGPVQQLLNGAGSIQFRLGELGSFSSPEQDVLMIQVESDDLARLNAVLDKLPNENRFDEYRPHVTVAYLKPGTAKKYLKLDNLMRGWLVETKAITFSNSERVTIEITLNCGGKGGKPGPCPEGDELEAIRLWATSRWGHIKGGQRTPQGSDLSKNFDKALEKLPEAKVPTYRGIALHKDLDRYQVGKDVMFETSESFSSSNDFAEGWAVEHPKVSGDTATGEHVPAVMVMPPSNRIKDLGPSLDLEGIGKLQDEHVIQHHTLARVTARKKVNGVDYIYFNGSEKVTPTTNAPRWHFMATADQLKAFQGWLTKLFTSEIIGRSEDELWRKYAEEGAKRGAGRSFDDVRKSALMKERPDLFAQDKQDELRDFYDGSRQEFLKSSFGRPVGIEKIKQLAGRTFTDLKGVTDSMVPRMSRVLLDGLVQGEHNNKIGKQLAEVMDWALPRAETIARTEISRAYVEGQLDALEAMGVEELGVMVEWSTAGDTEVCPKCQPLEGVVLKLDEARNMIPFHPNCRCALIPAQVGEDDDEKDQFGRPRKKSKGKIEDAFDEAGVEVTVSKKRPKALIGNRFSFLPLLNCGGVGGKPGPCPDGWSKVETTGEVVYGKSGRAVSILPAGSDEANKRLSQVGAASPALKKIAAKSVPVTTKEAEQALDAMPKQSSGLLATHPFQTRSQDEVISHWMELDTSPSGPRKLMDVPIDKIDAEESYMYPEKIRQYIKNPPSGPVGLATSGSGRFYLHDGNHRVAAAKLRGEKTVKMLVAHPSGN